MKTFKSTLLFLLVAGGIAGTVISITARPDSPCDNFTLSTELDLWQKVYDQAQNLDDIDPHENLDELLTWQRDRYHTRRNAWREWGYDDPFNLDLPYAKVINAAYLLRYGLQDNKDQWHGRLDYNNAGQAAASPAHYEISYRPENTKAWLAWAYTDDGYTALSCLLFCRKDSKGKNNFNNNPATRAGDFVHEGWHHWQNHNGIEVGHESGCPEDCASCCDWYANHFVDNYHSYDSDFGTMHNIIEGITPSGVTEEIIHSPNQVQVEFLCDLAEFAKDFVPTSVLEMAKAEANLRLRTRFLNPVSYRCGKPRPWLTD